MRIHTLTLLTTAALAVSAAIIVPMTTAQAGELRVGYTEDALTLDPANHRSRTTQTIIRNMYDGLFTRDPNMKVVPQAAESWKVIDATTYEVTLQKGITFHDGSPMTSEDVKYTFDRLTKDGAVGGQTSPRKSLVGPVKEVQIVDGRTVRFILSDPWPQFMAFMTLHEIVSKKFTEKVGAGGMSTGVMGSGPFKLAKWRKGDSVIMERFDGYYGGSQDLKPVGKACSETVIFKVIPENASRVAALLAGDVHIINDLPSHNIKQIEADQNTRVMAVNGTRSTYMALNNQSKPFNDVRVRRAVAHAIDRQLIVDKILNGKASLINGILGPDAFGKNKNLPAYEFDIAKSKALLAEAGYPNGLDVTLDVTGADKDKGEAIASLLTKAGIRTKVAVGESSQLSSRYRTKGKPIDGQMWLTSWGNGSLDPVGIFVPTHRSNDRGNSSGYANPAVDKLLDAANTETDIAKRAALYSQAEAIVNKDLPKVYLWVAQDLYGVSNRLSGWQPSADGRINLHDACVK
ncbi:MAG: ABC transporter substrate-binding protein [Rhodospirillales bacterium]|nr:ABC transporter substrate-binding protein [Rhodospirillales bacterium]